MNVRRATLDDLDLLMSLVGRLESELPPLPYPEDPAEFERGKVEKMVREGVALVAEDGGGGAIGYALARYGDHGPTTVYVSDLWVDANARGHGIGRELMRLVAEAASEHGSTHVVLDVDSKNTDAIAFYRHLGFEEGAKIFRVALGSLTQPGASPAESVGAVHVQTDDAQAVERVVTEFLPRLDRRASASVDGGRAWSAVRVEPFARDVLRKLGLELSYRFGVTAVLALEENAVVRFVLHDQGRMVDEYLSVPEYYGPLPPGDALALRANPTVVARLTGADPARVRAVARTAAGPGELPPARELYEAIAELMGLQA